MKAVRPGKMPYNVQHKKIFLLYFDRLSVHLFPENKIERMHKKHK